VADSLSRVSATQLVAMSPFSINSELLDQVKQSWVADEDIQGIINKLRNWEVVSKYTYSQNLLYRKGRLVVGRDAGLRANIIKLFYNSPLGGHFGMAVTEKRVTCLFW